MLLHVYDNVALQMIKFLQIPIISKRFKKSAMTYLLSPDYSNLDVKFTN